MARQMSPTDARAIDLVLNDTRSHAGFTEPVDDAVIRSVAGVDGMLRLLGELPTENPPAGLVARTMMLIQRQGDRVNSALQSRAFDMELGQTQSPA